MLKQDRASKDVINKDWSLREWHTPRLNDILLDDDQNLCIVTRVEGTYKKKIWVEDINGNTLYENVSADTFSLASFEQTYDFYIPYRKNKGWENGKVFTVKDKDYPLILQGMEYDRLRHKMLYVFLDINTPERKFFKTQKEDLIEFIPDYMYELAKSSFISDDTSSLRYKLQISIEDKGEEFHEDGWSVSGGALEFGEIEIALSEIEKLKNRKRIRRIASVLSKCDKRTISEISLNDDGEPYISAYTKNSGQPGLFNSRIAAAIAISILGSDILKNALSYDLDTYLI